MNKFLETQNLPRLNHGGLENLNRPVTSNEIESLIKNFLTRESLELVTTQVNSTKHLNKNVSILKLFQKLMRRKYFIIHSMKLPLP